MCVHVRQGEYADGRGSDAAHRLSGQVCLRGRVRDQYAPAAQASLPLSLLLICHVRVCHRASLCVAASHGRDGRPQRGPLPPRVRVPPTRMRTSPDVVERACPWVQSFFSNEAAWEAAYFGDDVDCLAAQASATFSLLVSARDPDGRYTLSQAVDISIGTPLYWYSPPRPTHMQPVPCTSAPLLLYTCRLSAHRQGAPHLVPLASKDVRLRHGRIEAH
jgi:hypothetical protein